MASVILRTQSFFRLIFWVIFCASQPVLAAQVSCGDVWGGGRSATFPATGVLTEGERRQLRTFVRESQQSAHETWNVVLHAYFDRRARLLPTEAQERVRRIMNQFVDTKVQWSGLDGDFAASAGGVRLPDTFRESPFFAIIIAHEIEHIIQLYDETTTGGPLRQLWIATRDKFDPSRLYLDERRAMLAEWELLSLIPEELVPELAALIRDSKLAPEQRALFERWLANVGSDAAKHLRAEHAAGRYSIAYVIAQKAVPNIIAGTVTFAAYNALALTCGLPTILGP